MRLLADLGEPADAGCSMVLVDQGLERIAPAVRRRVPRAGEVRYDGPGRPPRRRGPRPPGAQHHAGSQSGHAVCPRRRPGGGDALVVSDLSREYGGVPALQGIDLRVAAGSVLGIAGGNGAGKTTLLDAISATSTTRAASTLGGRPWSTAGAPARRTRRARSHAFSRVPRPANADSRCSTVETFDSVLHEHGAEGGLAHKSSARAGMSSAFCMCGATEDDAGVRQRRAQRHQHFLARVQADARSANRVL